MIVSKLIQEVSKFPMDANILLFSDGVLSDFKVDNVKDKAVICEDNHSEKKDEGVEKFSSEDEIMNEENIDTELEEEFINGVDLLL